MDQRNDIACLPSPERQLPGTSLQGLTGDTTVPRGSRLAPGGLHFRVRPVRPSPPPPNPGTPPPSSRGPRGTRRGCPSPAPCTPTSTAPGFRSSSTAGGGGAVPRSRDLPAAG